MIYYYSTSLALVTTRGDWIGAIKFGTRDTVYTGRYRYALDGRLVPVWAFYACLNAFVVYYNYVEGVRYMDGSLRTCFEESYCFALIELFNRNLGPTSNVVCSMFYGRRYKCAGLTGAERTLRFLDETRGPASPGRLSRVFRFYSVASVAAYLTFTIFYMAMVPPVIIVAYWASSMGQVVVYMLVFVQYYVLYRGFQRVNDLVEVADVTGRPPTAARPSLARLCDVYDELCTLVEHVNRAYAPEMLLQWAYNIVRVIMVVFRLCEIVSALDGPLASVTSYLIVEHVGELFLFVLHTSCTCVVGERLSREVGTCAWIATGQWPIVIMYRRRRAGQIREYGGVGVNGLVSLTSKSFFGQSFVSNR